VNQSELFSEIQLTKNSIGFEGRSYQLNSRQQPLEIRESHATIVDELNLVSNLLENGSKAEFELDSSGTVYGFYLLLLDQISSNRTIENIELLHALERASAAIREHNASLTKAKAFDSLEQLIADLQE
jgi:hypothetical protein